jgi:hypothetical protein
MGPARLHLRAGRGPPATSIIRHGSCCSRGPNERRTEKRLMAKKSRKKKARKKSAANHGKRPNS